jgi:hypothetical protein
MVAKEVDYQTSDRRLVVSQKKFPEPTAHCEDDFTHPPEGFLDPSDELYIDESDPVDPEGIFFEFNEDFNSEDPAGIFSQTPASQRASGSGTIIPRLPQNHWDLHPSVPPRVIWDRWLKRSA